MTLSTILRLGRVSNLPTVWTNTLAGAVLAVGAAGLAPGPLLLAGLALTLFYIGGMWLNDAFDAEIDARERANRPIPNGEIKRSTVFVVGFALILGGVIIGMALGAIWQAVAVAAAVILYDWLHKRTGLAPVIMGATRYYSYALAAGAVGLFAGEAMWGAFGLFAYIIGLTYAAKQEAYDKIEAAWPLAVLALPVAYAFWASGGALVPLALAVVLVGIVGFALHRLFRRAPGDVPRAVITLIAGISIYDAVLIAGTGATVLGLVAAAGFVLTLSLQRIAAGT